MPDETPMIRVQLPPRVHHTPEEEARVAIDDVAVSAEATPGTGTVSLELVTEHALAAGAAYAERAALEAVAAEPTVPALPAEPTPSSRHGRRWNPTPPEWPYAPPRAPRAGARPAPDGFWHELAYGITFTLVNLGDSRAVRERKALDARIAAPLDDGARSVPVISGQGGVGATTVTALLGMALADGREDRVLAVDAHPDRGILAERLDEDTRLEVSRTADAGDGGCSVVLTDGAAGVLEPAMREALSRADAVVIVSGGTSEQARLASEAVSWLEQNDLADLAQDAVVAINTSTPGTRYESLDAIEAHFRARVREVVRIPYDEELVAGAPVRYGALRPDTRDAARDLAAKVMDGLREGPAA